MTHGSLFSGIGGFDLAAKWMGWENVFHCEINPFGQKMLKYHFPNSISYDDITKTDFTIHRGNIDIISGGFPCQPYSMAGKRLGKEDARHLWPKMLRVIREVQPTWVVGENVFGLINWSGGLVFHEVQTDLEAEGYKVQPYVLPACAVNAPHKRDRVWFVAYSKSARTGKNIGWLRSVHNGCSDGKENAAFAADTMLTRGRQDNRQGKSEFFDKDGEKPNWNNFPTQSPICSGNDGISDRLDGITFSKWRNESIKGYGNAVVPQVVYAIFKTIEEYEQGSK